MRNIKKYINEIWINWEELIQLGAGKKIVFFGRGEWVDKTLPYLNFKAEYIVDNSEYEQGQIEHLCICTL